MKLGPEFAKLWAGQSISRVGSEISIFALPTFAVLVLHASPLQIGTLTALQFVPFPVLGLFAGVWIDRTSRRGVMIAADIVRALAMASIPLVSFTGAVSMLHLFIIALVTGTASVFFEVAYQSYVPVVVAKEQLTAANTRLEFSSSAARIAGSAFGGLLIGAVGAAKAIALDAFSYVISIVSLLLIRSGEARPAAPAGELRRSFFAELGEGLHVVWNNRNLRLIAAATALSNLGASMIGAVEFIFFYNNLRLTPGALGVVLGVANIGFVGAMLAGPTARRFGMKRTLLYAMVAATIASAAIPLAQYGAPLLVIFLTTAVQMCSIPMYNITQVSWRQGAVPDHLQGRMNATVRTVVWGTMPLGATLGGLLGGVTGIVPAMYIGAAVMALGILALLPLNFAADPTPTPG